MKPSPEVSKALKITAATTGNGAQNQGPGGEQKEGKFSPLQPCKGTDVRAVGHNNAVLDMEVVVDR